MRLPTAWCQPVLVGFLLFGPDKAGNFAVLDYKKGGSLGVFRSPVSRGGAGEEKEDLVQDGVGNPLLSD